MHGSEASTLRSKWNLHEPTLNPHRPTCRCSAAERQGVGQAGPLVAGEGVLAAKGIISWAAMLRRRRQWWWTRRLVPRGRSGQCKQLHERDQFRFGADILSRVADLSNPAGESATARYSSPEWCNHIGPSTNTIEVQRQSRRTKFGLGLGKRRRPGARYTCTNGKKYHPDIYNCM